MAPGFWYRSKHNGFLSLSFEIDTTDYSYYKKDAAVLCISKDLSPALNKFCGAEGIVNVTVLSAYRAECN